jgi:LPXTG-motif cell wall-anchored protein
MLGRTLNIRIEVNQVKGPELYVNDILVSKPATYLTDPDDKNSEVAANAYWGAQTNYGEFAIGFFVSQRVKLTIDNIKVTGWVNEYTEADMLRTYNAAPNKEPATGDATIYVVVAMAVSFISLAALVVTKRRSSRVK